MNGNKGTSGEGNEGVLQKGTAISALGRSLPDLDTVVLSALALLETATLPSLPFELWNRSLVLGSGNAAVVGKLLFAHTDARYADESTYTDMLARHRDDIESAVVISASGGKDADDMAHALQKTGIPTWLLTNNANAPARAYIDPSRILLFPKAPEPNTYNVSTYMGMLLAQTREDPKAIAAYINDAVASRVPDTLAKYDAFYFIIPSWFIAMKEMFLTKFDELFGSRVSARVYTLEQSKHAKTVVPSNTECFVSFGSVQTLFGNEVSRVHIPLPENAGSAAMMALGYFVIGQIQKQHPPYFKDNIERYIQTASALFGEHISLIAG